jgi:hypothetical protein
MEDQKGVYQITWTKPDGVITQIALHNANSLEDASKIDPDLKASGKKKSVKLVDEKRLRSLLGLLGVGDSEDLRVWFYVDINRNKNEYEYLKKYVRLPPELLEVENGTSEAAN